MEYHGATANERVARSRRELNPTIYRSAREVTVTSRARLTAKCGAAVCLGLVVIASGLCKVTLCVDRIVLVSKLSF